MNINWNDIFQKIKPLLLTIVYDVFIVIGVLFIARIVLKGISALTAKTIKKSNEMADNQKAKGIVTSMTILRSVCRYLIYFVAIVTIMDVIGFKNTVNNVLVTAGIGTLIISMGAQNIVADFLAGLFLIFENRYAVGDYVKIGEYEGIVTSIAMRATYLRNAKGQKVIIPNGKVADIINYSTEYNLAMITVPTPYEADTRKIVSMIQEVADKYYEDNKEQFVEKANVLAITAYSANSADITVCAKVKPNSKWKIERELRLLIKERLGKEGITFPYNGVIIKK